MQSLVCEEVALCELKHIVWSVHEQGLQKIGQECPQLRMPPDVVLALNFNLSLSEASTHATVR